MKFDGKKITNAMSNLRGIGLIGITDIISGGITGIFWLYIASFAVTKEGGGGVVAGVAGTPARVDDPSEITMPS